MHAAVADGDLPGLQAAVGALQHPEQELDALVAMEGEATALAPLHRAALGGKETCLKVGPRGGDVAAAACHGASTRPVCSPLEHLQAALCSCVQNTPQNDEN